MAEAIEGVAIAGELHAPAEVESRDAVGDRDDPADALADIIGKDHAAHRAEQDRDDQRDQKRPLDGLAKSEAVADGPAVDQPFAVRKPMQLQRCLLRRGLPPEAQQSVAEAVAERVGRPRDCRQIADPLLSRGIEERDRRLQIAERIAVVDRILERRHPAGPIDVGENRALLDDLAAKSRGRLVMRAPVDEAQDREIGKEGEQPCQQRDPDAGRQRRARPPACSRRP